MSERGSLEDRLFGAHAGVRLYLGDSRELLPRLQVESVDAVITDPPYHLQDAPAHRRPRTRRPGGRSLPAPRTSGFMGMRWDGGTTAFEPRLWADALGAIKPGGHLLAFGSPRTYHRLAAAIEDAGWEIRDCLVWAYATGFPKSRNLTGDWHGWGTTLKPAWEPILLARKRMVGSVAANVAAFGTGALHIDACRIPVAGGRPDRVTAPNPDANGVAYAGRRHTTAGFDGGSRAAGATAAGRWPANLVLGDPIFDGSVPEVVGGRQTTSGLLRAGQRRGSIERGSVFFGRYRGHQTTGESYGDRGGFSRFFLIPKAGRLERERGLHSDDGRPVRGRARRNHHPTVKPLALMRHLVRLVTPPGGLVLDPFLGSGTTAMAAHLEGARCLGIEREREYLTIALARLRAVADGDSSTD